MTVEDRAVFVSRFYAAAISTFVVAMLAVPAKLWCRTRTQGLAALALDDALCIVTLVLANVYFWIAILALLPDMGKQGVEISLDETNDFLKFLFAAVLTYLCSIAFIKFIVLALYWKIFSIAARIPLALLTASVVAWLIAVLSINIFGCRPIGARWNAQIDNYQCVDFRSVYLGSALPNVIVDFILVIMPMPYVWRLRLPIVQRLIITGMFALGFFVGAVSAIRLHGILNIPVGSDNIIYYIRNTVMWSVVEINVGLTCACLPSMRHILQAFGLRILHRTPSDGDHKSPAERVAEPSAGTGAQGVSRASRPRFGRGFSWKREWGAFASAMGVSRISSDEEACEEECTAVDVQSHATHITSETLVAERG